MNTPSQSNPYLANLIMTASPAQLIVILHDGLIRCLGSAYDGFSETDAQKRFESVNNNLVRAQNIITELNATLDMKNGGEIACQLSALYDFFNSTLCQINTAKEPSALLRIIHMISELRDGWSQTANATNVSTPPKRQVAIANR